MKNNMKKNLAKILIISLIFSNQGMFTFADNIENIIEETTESIVDNEQYIDDENDIGEDIENIIANDNSDVEIDKEESESILESNSEELFDEQKNDEKIEPEEEIEDDSEEYEEEPEEDFEDVDDNLHIDEDVETEETNGETSEDIVEENIDETTTVIESELEEEINEDMDCEETSNDVIEEENISEDETSAISEEAVVEENNITEEETVETQESGIIDREEIEQSEDFSNIDDGNEVSEILNQANIQTEEVSNHFATPSETYDEWYLFDLEMMEQSLLGDPVSQTITLDFGVGPGFDYTSNWAGKTDAINKFTAGPNPGQYSISGMSSSKIFEVFSGTDYPNVSYGLGAHVLLPTFNGGDNAIWEGYKFICWKDEEGNNVTDSQNGAFLYAFQSTGNTTYTAYWETVDNTYNLNVDFCSERTSTQSTIFSNTNENKIHRNEVYIQPYSIPGFKIDQISPRVGGVPLATNPLDALKSKNVESEYVTIDSDDITVNSTTYEVLGAMPNHELDVKVCYIPDPAVTYKYTINYVNKDTGVVISPKVIEYYNAETLLDTSPLDLANYAYEYAEVNCGPTSYLTRVYGVGYFTLDGQITSPSDKTDTSSNMGRLYTLMPNQDLEITYYYTLVSETTTITIEKQVQQRNGEYVMSSSTVSLEPSTGDIIGSFIVENKENVGYGQPVITNENPTLINTLYSYNSSTDGEFRFYVTDYTPCTIVITYNYDYTTSYWGKVEFFTYTTPDAHGHINIASGSLAMDNRYFKRGTYPIEELFEDIEIHPDVNYTYKIYSNNATSPGPAGSELTGDITLGSYKGFFIEFVEDPPCWLDIRFEAAPESTLYGITLIHVSKDTPVASLSFPTVVTTTGFMHLDGQWEDENGNLLQDPLSDIEDTYIKFYPIIVSTIGEYEGSVKPLVYTEPDTNGKGKILFYTKYDNRKYILTDINNKILNIQYGMALDNGFTGLNPGKTYYVYEARSYIAMQNIGETLNIIEGISEKAEIGISSVYTNYSYDENNNKITVSPIANTQYALLDDKYNITYNWTTNPNFTNLANGTYYLIVAKSSSDTIVANDENCIRNGVVVYTEKTDVNTRINRLILIGDNASARNMTPVSTSGSGVDKITVYLLQSDRYVTLIGGNNMKWEVCSENVALSSMSSQMPTMFVMPDEDVIIRNYGNPPASQRTRNKFHFEGTKMGYMNSDAILNVLNTDTNVASSILENAIVNHHIVIKRRPTKKSVVDTFTTKIAPYEYELEVISDINDKPYPNEKVPDIDLSVLLALEHDETVNRNYTLNVGTKENLYDVTDDTDIGSLKIPINYATNVCVEYDKYHKVVFKSTIDPTVNDIYYVLDNTKMSESVSDYTSTIQNRFANFYDMTLVTQPSVSTYNAKEYLYGGVYDNNVVFDATNSIIKKKKTLTVKYTLNQEREDIKELLSTEISRALNKYSQLITVAAKTTLNNAILAAKSVKDFQMGIDVNTLQEAYNALHQIVITTYDPPEEFEVTLDANGGAVNTNVVTVLFGQGSVYKYNILNTVTASREGYTFVTWNTAVNGGGQDVNANTILSATPAEVLYAIWNQNPVRRNNSGGGGGGGGGGGSGRVRTEATVGEKVLVDPINNNNNLLMADKNLIYPNNGFPGFSNVVTYKNNEISNYIRYYPEENRYELIFNYTDSGLNVTNQWFMHKVEKDGKEMYKTYLADANGATIHGLHIEGDLVYYFDEKLTEDYSTLKTGWIYKEDTKSWYYADPRIGAIMTGWQNIDGKDYYFGSEKVTDVNNQQVVNQEAINKGYGKLYINCMTPDGHMVDENGQRVIMQP